MFRFFCCAAEEPSTYEDVDLTRALSTAPGNEMGDGENAPLEKPVEDEQAPEPEAAPKAAACEPAPVQEPASSPEPAPEVPNDCTEWEVTITKSPGKTMVGVNLDCSSQSAPCVKGLQAGSLVVEWNKAHPDKKVSIGDAIITVNGATDTASKILRLREDSFLQMRFRRVSDFIVAVNRGTEGLGVSFAGPGTGPAKVHRIAEGKAIDTYNKKAEPGKVVVPGDIVMTVNGDAGSKDQVVSAITKASGLIILQVSHPSA